MLYYTVFECNCRKLKKKKQHLKDFFNLRCILENKSQLHFPYVACCYFNLHRIRSWMSHFHYIKYMHLVMPFILGFSALYVLFNIFLFSLYFFLLALYFRVCGFYSTLCVILKLLSWLINLLEILKTSLIITINIPTNK